MKLLGVILAVCVTGYLAEVCTVNSDCTSTTCSSGSAIVCQHPADAGVTTGGGLCTCAATGSDADCITASECYGTSSLTCPDSQRHCYDGTCICDRFPVGR